MKFLLICGITTVESVRFKATMEQAVRKNDLSFHFSGACMWMMIIFIVCCKLLEMPRASPAHRKCSKCAFAVFYKDIIVIVAMKALALQLHRFEWMSRTKYSIVVHPRDFSMEILTHAWCILARTSHIRTNTMQFTHEIFMRMPPFAQTHVVYARCCGGVQCANNEKEQRRHCYGQWKCGENASYATAPQWHPCVLALYAIRILFLFIVICSVGLWSRCWTPTNAFGGAIHQYNRTAYMEWTIRTTEQTHNYRNSQSRLGKTEFS